MRFALVVNWNVWGVGLFLRPHDYRYTLHLITVVGLLIMRGHADGCPNSWGCHCGWDTAGEF